MLASAFADDGHNIAIVSSRSRPGTNLLGQLPMSVHVHQLPEDEFESPRNIAALSKILENFAPDVIVFQDSYAPIESTLFAALESHRGVMPKIVIVEHNMPKVPVGLGEITLRDGVVRFVRRIVGRILYPARYCKSLRYERRRRQYLYERADKYVFLSSRYIRISNRIAGVEGCDKLIAIPNPVKTPLMVPDVNAKRKEILYCGSLIPSKGVSRIIAIWGKLEKMFPDWKLTIVGDGSERVQLERQAKMSASERVCFEGFQRETEVYYHRASILVMASSFEGWPMVLGEAMQQGCVPVVYGSFLSAYDIIDNGKNGCVIPPFDENGFIESLRRLMSDDALRIEIGKAAMQKSAMYSVNEIKNCWYNVFKDVSELR
jgi:glycosyltransferase involved in cell wall biosynthesis